MSKPSPTQVRDEVSALKVSLTATETKLTSAETSIAEIRTALEFASAPLVFLRVRFPYLPAFGEENRASVVLMAGQQGASLLHIPNHCVDILDDLVAVHANSVPYESGYL